MSEEESGYSAARKDSQSYYEQNVIPKQQEVLKNLTTAPIGEILGKELEGSINTAFNKTAEYSTERAEKMANNLKEIDPMGRPDNVRQVGNYLIRRRSIGLTLDTTEIFDLDQELPPELLEVVRQGNLNINDFLPYKFRVVTDTNTGLSTDVLRLSSGKANILAFTQEPITGQMPRGNISVLADSDEFFTEWFNNPIQSWLNSTRLVLKRELAYAHEAGHSHQFSRNDKQVESILERTRKQARGETLTPQELADATVSERNAWAFAISAFRRYRDLGVDLTQIADLGGLENALKSYDKGQGTENKFSKTPLKSRAALLAHQLRGFTKIK